MSATQQQCKWKLVHLYKYYGRRGRKVERLADSLKVSSSDPGSDLWL